jgi:hypothetical protein
MMNRAGVLFSALMMFGVGGTAFAQESWLLLPQQNGEDAVAVAARNTLRIVATPGRVGSYGLTDHGLEFLSYEPRLARHVLTIVDQFTGAVAAPVLINMDDSVIPVRWMSGAIPDVALINHFAYFVSYTHRDGAGGPEHNPGGGYFDLDRVSLADGQVEQFPLPKDCVNPRLVNFRGMPLVYSWEGFGVAKFDVTKQAVVTLVSDSDVSDIVQREGNAKYVRQGPQTAIFSDYAIVPGQGAFRLSRVGELQQVLNADLSLVSIPRRTVKVAETGEQPEIRLGTLHSTTVIGVVRTLSDRLELDYIDPVTFNVEWRLTLPKTTSIPSLYGLSDNAVVYLDQATATIVKVTQQGQTVMHRMTADQAFRGVNILSVAGTARP